MLKLCGASGNPDCRGWSLRSRMLRPLFTLPGTPRHAGRSAKGDMEDPVSLYGSSDAGSPPAEALEQNAPPVFPEVGLLAITTEESPPPSPIRRDRPRLPPHAPVMPLDTSCIVSDRKQVRLLQISRHKLRMVDALLDALTMASGAHSRFVDL